ncbi:TonB-dependent receptor [Prevotella brunnea]|uniref:TonB-dependent receptor n=1 Tax=Prevotella brunnea TaxID=2508867 RepID=A0A5C8GJP0_9BACT|nr:TonB-dependent receptor [Prevotella brunnea]MDR0186542.1 TonB-dependent receptor [Prevotella brunnea]TXJ62187.1 TonB-dependent receptor [Prevotella brunnea]
MQKKLKLAILAVCSSSIVFAQNTNTKVNKDNEMANTMDESAFTFTEAQLGEDNDRSENITILNSNSNVYASEVGYLYSPMRFRYRALNQKYNDVYINGAPMNDMETGQFRFSLVGGLNQQTRNVDFALPFENNNFSMTGLAGSNNYDFRAGSMAAGHRLTLSAANRNYLMRGMYTYGSGFNNKGWAIAANITYRWANRGYVEGTFYNALSYFFGVQKKWDNGHSLSLSTWGNPTERASQGASTDEAYWLANDYQYNPYWGYQNGHKRNSRVVNDFAPAGILTWDWDINDKLKLTTSFFGKYSMYKSTKLNYNNSDNPQPDYWKNLPSSYYDVWNENNARYRTSQAFNDWNSAVEWWRHKENRQIQWDRLYYANRQAAQNGQDALYYLQAKHNDNTTLTFSSSLTNNFGKDKVLNVGIILGQNFGHHYQTMEDMLGAKSFHNINTYAIGTYTATDPRVQYDLNTMGAQGLGALVYEGDKFGYDYNINVRRGIVWSNYAQSIGNIHYIIAGKMAYDNMYRKGYMRNGMFADNSYGKSKHADFLSGGGKFSGIWTIDGNNTLSLGLGYEHRAPKASTAFVSPEMNNNFIQNLRNERIFSSEFSYQYANRWLHANLSAYYNHLTHVTEWQNFYFDDANSFTYVSMTGIKKNYYGVELGLDFKLTSFLNFKTLGTWSEAKNINNADVVYMNSTKNTYYKDIVYNKGMRESGTPLSAYSGILSFHQGGWFIDISGNYYDRIYLSYAPSLRYQSTLETMGTQFGGIDANGNYTPYAQSKGKGGFMLDASIGKSIYLKHGSLAINLMITNLLNNQELVSGGYEQSRSSYTVNKATGEANARAYNFYKNPKKYYVNGINGMLNLAYKF